MGLIQETAGKEWAGERRGERRGHHGMKRRILRRGGRRRGHNHDRGGEEVRGKGIREWSYGTGTGEWERATVECGHLLWRGMMYCCLE